MRISALCLGLSLVSFVPIMAHADDPLPYVAGPQPDCLNLPPHSVFMGPIICKTVTLNDEASLARLKRSNPDDYAIARRVIQAASQLCTPGAAAPQVVGLKAGELACSAVLMPSNPPKREVWFKIGHTMYQMLVTVPL